MWDLVLEVMCWDRTRIRDEGDDGGPDLEERIAVELEGQSPSRADVSAAMQSVCRQAERWLNEKGVALWAWTVATTYSIELRDR